MPRIGEFKSDKKKTTEGVWVDAGGGLMLRIAKHNNPKMQEYLRKHGRPYAYRMRSGGVDMSEMEKLQKDAIAQCVLLGWDNLQDDDGSDIPYSHDKARELLDIDDFYELVLNLSQDATLFKTEDEKEEERGNSKAVSGGNLSGESTKDS